MKYLLALILLGGLSATAQKAKIFYFKKGDVFVRSKDEADYIRVVTEPESKGQFSDVREVYKNEVLKREGQSSSSGPHITWEGKVVSYDSTGIKVSEITYKKGLLWGSLCSIIRMAG